jgi:hypothetical protein
MRAPSPVVLLLPLALLAGCAGYELGPTMGRTSGVTSIQINAFANHTIEPRLTDAVTQAIRKRVQQDGTYRLNTDNTGDLVVVGTILEYERTGVTFDPDDVISPRDFVITMVAQVKLLDRNTGRLLWDRKIAGRSSTRLLSDLPNTERQAIPLVADDLARRAVALMVDGEW